MTNSRWVSLFVASMLCVNQTGKDQGTSFSPSPAQQSIEKYADWMSRIPDCVSLAGLSLPGTHDSCALRNGASFGFARCQSWKLQDQLRVGVRFIDIRCRHVGNKFHIYHGIIDQHMTFAQVHDVCLAFLKAHPTECVVMSIKEEYQPDNNTRSFAQTFAAETKKAERLWYIKGSTPKLSTVRGKIVLVDRVGTLGGLPWKTFHRQDDYQAEPAEKSELMRSHLKAATQAKPTDWFINFSSGTVPRKLITPERYARQSNLVLLKYLREERARNAGPVRIGTIVMDFPSEELIAHIVETNLQPEKTKRETADPKP